MQIAWSYEPHWRSWLHHGTLCSVSIETVSTYSTVACCSFEVDSRLEMGEIVMSQGPSPMMVERFQSVVSSLFQQVILCLPLFHLDLSDKKAFNSFSHVHVVTVDFYSDTQRCWLSSPLFVLKSGDKGFRNPASAQVNSWC